MHKAETHLQQGRAAYLRNGMSHYPSRDADRKLEHGGQTAALPYARDLLTAILAGLDAAWAHRRALLLRRN
jgi:hypothetical protein